MRKIKFRMWKPGDDEKPDEMIDGDSLAFEEYAPLKDLLFQDGIMQYIGIKDSQGKEIYEGDIIESFVNNKESIKHIIRYNENFASFVVDLLPFKNFGINDCRFDKGWIDEFNNKVVGNKFENPELLK